MSEKPSIQELIDKFAEKSVDDLETLNHHLDTLLSLKEEEIDALGDDIAAHRAEIQKLEQRQKALSDEAWPYSLMKLTVDSALEQKRGDE